MLHLLLESRNIKNLNLRISNQKLIEGFDLSLVKGKRIGITGPSGCGKTTLMRSVLTSELPKTSSSEIFDILYKDSISYIPQSNGLLPWFSIRHNLEIFSKKESELIKSLIKEFELHSCINYFPSEVSGGEYQRASLACAIASESNFHIADEPLTEIDLVTKWRILRYWTDYISEFDVSLILISHDIDILTYMCDEIIILSQKPSSILERYYNNSSYPRDMNDILHSKIRKKIFDLISRNQR